MPALFMLTPGTCASLNSERMEIVVPAQEPDEERAQTFQVALREIEHVVLTTSAQLSTQLLAELMRRQIPVIVTAGGERIIGHCFAPAPHSRARLMQYRRTLDPSFGCAIASALVEAKILNQRRVLQRLAANRPEQSVGERLRELEELARKAVQAQTVETLRGYEGTAAGRYFEIYGSFFPEEAPFERRSRRPPHNAVNAVLSYAYTLLAAEMECHVHVAGLDPALGFYHETEDRRPSLALDLIEPFRAPIADALALDLFSHRTLKPAEHFETHDGGVFLNTEGKKRFFVSWERRLTRDFQDLRTGTRTTLRDAMRRIALSAKKSITDGDVFEPWYMNG